MSEHALQTAIIDYLQYCGALVIRINSGAVVSEENGRRRFTRFYKWFVLGSKPQTAGVSDVLALHRGKFFAIEIKIPERKGKATEAQQNFIVAVMERGGIGLVVSDVDELRPYFEA